MKNALIVHIIFVIEPHSLLIKKHHGVRGGRCTLRLKARESFLSQQKRPSPFVTAKRATHFHQKVHLIDNMYESTVASLRQQLSDMSMDMDVMAPDLVTSEAKEQVASAEDISTG